MPMRNCKNNLKVHRFLITARDPASANDMSDLILQFAEKYSHIDLLILAQEPGYSIIKKKIESYVSSCKVELRNIGDLNINRCMNIINSIVDEFRPTAVVTGISGPDYGLDEVALKVCTDNNIKTFSIQSYWGDTNTQLGTIATTIFVLDSFAKKITKKREPNAEIIITGSFQNFKFDSINVEKIRIQFRDKHKLTKKKAIVFFGQPLYEYSFYYDTIRKLASCLASSFKHHQVFYKPHPKENSTSIKWIVDNFTRLNLDFKKTESDFISLLAGTDLSLSLFSTAGYDLQSLIANSSQPFSTPIYLFYDRTCREWYENYSKLSEIPMTHDNMGLVVKNESKLCENVALGLSESYQEDCFRNIKKNFPVRIDSPADVIINRLIQ
jgi:hypothetical protein